MSTEQPDVPGDRPSASAQRSKKSQSSFLALGIVFLSVGIGMSFGDSSTWIAFVIIGIAFLGMSASAMTRRKNTPTDRPKTDGSPGQTPDGEGSCTP